MNSIEVLEDGLALIEKGWVKGKNATPRVPGQPRGYCAVAAITKAAGLSVTSISYDRSLCEPHKEAWDALLKVVTPALKVKMFEVINPSMVAFFNDAPGCTHEVIIDTFKQAIREEKARLGVSLEVPTTQGAESDCPVDPTSDRSGSSSDTDRSSDSSRARTHSAV